MIRLKYWFLIGLLAVLDRPATANVVELYEEIRIHNAEIEARLSDWSKRARLHADQMTISTHPKLVPDSCVAR